LLYRLRNHALKPRATPMMNKLLHGSQTVWTTNMPAPLLWVDAEGVLHQIKIASGSLLEIGLSSQTLWEITKVVGA
jgi:hypothetical protein